MGNTNFNTVSNMLDSEPLYIVAQSDGGVGPVLAFNNIGDLKEYLEDVDFYTDDVCVFYGTCISATAIPEDNDGVETYLVVESKNSEGYVLGLECEDEETIIGVISDTIGTKVDKDDNHPIEMENLFILYGAELPIRITVIEDDVDDGLLEDCKKLKYQAEELASCA